MSELFRILPFLTGLAFAVGTDSGLDDLVDYGVTLANMKIEKLGFRSVWVDVRDLDLDSHVKRVRVYDLGTIRRLGDATLSYHEGSPDRMRIIVEIGLSELTVHLDLQVFFFLSGDADLHINDNSVRVEIDANYYGQRCELELISADVKLRGLDVGVSGLTFIGNYFAKRKIRSAYDSNVDHLENRVRNSIVDIFDSVSYIQTICGIIRP